MELASASRPGQARRITDAVFRPRLPFSFHCTLSFIRECGCGRRPVNGRPDPFAALPCCPFRLTADSPTFPQPVPFASSGYSERRSGHDHFIKRTLRRLRCYHRSNHCRNRSRSRASANALASCRRINRTSHQCRKLERLSRRQHRRPLGIGILPAVRSWPLGHISPVAREGRTSPQGREIVHHHFLP